MVTNVILPTKRNPSMIKSLSIPQTHRTTSETRKSESNNTNDLKREGEKRGNLIPNVTESGKPDLKGRLREWYGVASLWLVGIGVGRTGNVGVEMFESTS